MTAYRSHTTNGLFMAAKWIKTSKKVTIYAENMDKLTLITPDDGGKIGIAISDHLKSLYENTLTGNVFAKPKISFNDPTVARGAGGQHGIQTGQMTQGSSYIQLPPPDPNDTTYQMDVELQMDPDITNPDTGKPKLLGVRVHMDLYSAAAILHEVNHSIHRFVNGGEYMQPKSRLILGAVDQDLDRGIMSRALQIDHDYDKAEKIKKANEMETYWLCCCDAAKYNFSEAAILKIKAVNNKNLLFGGYEILANPKQQETLDRREDDDKLWSKVYDIEKESPVEYAPPSDDIFNDEPGMEPPKTTDEL